MNSGRNGGAHLTSARISAILYKRILIVGGSDGSEVQTFAVVEAVRKEVIGICRGDGGPLQQVVACRDDTGLYFSGCVACGSASGARNLAFLKLNG